MPDNIKPYQVHTSDSLKPGEKLKIEHWVSFEKDKADISALVALPLEELEKRRALSSENEQAAFDSICGSVSYWESKAAQTMLFDKAIEYAKTHACEHSSNQWGSSENDMHSRSNAVYKMTWHVYEHTQYDRQKQASVPVSWDATWSVYTNPPKTKDVYSNGVKIAGQERKRFTDKSAMEKYIKGRIAAYDGLFKEISPPVPQEHIKSFMVNGLLLPGYTVAGEKTAVVSVSETDRPQESVLARIAADKEAKKANPANREGSSQDKATKYRGKNDAEID